MEFLIISPHLLYSAEILHLRSKKGGGAFPKMILIPPQKPEGMWSLLGVSCHPACEKFCFGVGRSSPDCSFMAFFPNSPGASRELPGSSTVAPRELPGSSTGSWGGHALPKTISHHPAGEKCCFWVGMPTPTPGELPGSSPLLGTPQVSLCQSPPVIPASECRYEISCWKKVQADPHPMRP